MKGTVKLKYQIYDFRYNPLNMNLCSNFFEQDLSIRIFYNN